MIEVKLVGRNFILDESGFQSLNSKGFAEKNGQIYFLNIYEVLFLLEKNKIEVINNLENNSKNWILLKFKKNSLNKYCKISFSKIIKKFNISISNYFVYKDLILKGYIVKSGIKYGCTFRIYKKDKKNLSSEHSLWLVEPVIGENKIFFKDLLGKNRIAHSANKKLLFAIVDIENSVTYIENSWKKV